MKSDPAAGQPRPVPGHCHAAKPTPPPPTPRAKAHARNRIELYQDARGQWRWRVIANRQIVADSAEGYTRKSSAKRGFKALTKVIYTAHMEEVTP